MDKLAEHFADLAAKYGPTIADAAKAAAQTEAYSCLAAAAFSLIFAAAFSLIGRFIFVRIESESNPDGRDEMWIMASIVLWATAGLLSLFGLWTFADPWTWTTINHPELWIAKKAFGL
jgi:hypothetical protein